jgi:hypothetical protein
LKESGFTTLKVYDILGREVKTLISENLEGNRTYNLNFDGDKLVSGIYLLKLQQKDKVRTIKMILMK